MTQAALQPAGLGAERLTLWGMAPFAAGVFMLLIYSAGWVFPLFGEDTAAAGGLIRNMNMPAYVAGVFLVALSPRDTLGALLRQPFLILLMLLTLASVFWSIAPDQSARRVFALYCTTLGGVVLAARWSWARMAEVWAAAFAVLAVASLVMALAVPSIGVMQELFPGAWRGLWVEKNALGGNMALGFAVLAAAAMLNPRRAPLWWGFAALALGLVLMSTSKTSLVALLLGAGGVSFVWLARRSPAAGVAMTWIAVFAMLVGAGVMLLASDVVFELLGKDATLTGRTRIWEAAMRQIEQRPWTGFGYGVVWDPRGAWGPQAWIVHQAGFTAQHAHNAWIEQWLGMGVLGVAAFGLFYLQAVVLACAAVFRERGAYLAAPVLLVYSLMTVTESVAVTYNDFRWVLCVAVAVKLAWPGRGPGRL